MFPNNKGWTGTKPPSGSFRLNKQSSQAKGLVGWWPLLAGRGSNTIPDLLKRGHIGTLINDPTWSMSAERGYGVEFDSNNDVIAIANPGNIDPSYSSLTVSLWLRWDGDEALDQYIIGKREVWPNVRWQFYCRNSDNSLVWQSGANQVIFLGNTPTAGKVQHFVITQNGTNSYLYIDGKQVDSNTALFSAGSASDTVSIGNIWIGSDWYTQAWYGAIYEGRVYDKFLLASDVWEQYINSWELYEPTRPKYWAITIAEEEEKVPEIIQPNRRFPIHQLRL